MPPDQPLSVDFLTSRIRILATELRAVRFARVRAASGAHVHRLDNLITTITAALHLTEHATVQAEPETMRLLVILADAALHEARRLLFQSANRRAPVVRERSRQRSLKRRLMVYKG